MNMGIIMTIITLTGNIGSGKTTVGKILAERLNYSFFSMGEFVRKKAQEQNMSILQFNKLGQNNPIHDLELDQYYSTIKENSIIDGRLAWYHILTSFKIFLKCNYEIAAQRIYTKRRVGDHGRENINHLIQDIQKREEEDQKRLFSVYEVNFLKEEHYHLVINTDDKTLDEVVQMILDKYEEFIELKP